jgi:hypothetical protein
MTAAQIITPDSAILSLLANRMEIIAIGLLALMEN